MSKLKFAIRLTALSPIHIGCDEEYSPPYFYVMGVTRRVEGNRTTEIPPRMVTIDHSQILGSVTHQEINRLFPPGDNLPNLKNISQLQDLLKEKKVKGRDIEVSNEFYDHYQTVKNALSENNLQIINQFLINRTSFQSISQLPYIPGSSLKGSIRTGYLNLLKGQYRGSLERNANRDVQKSLLSMERIENDPFRQLRISDLNPIISIQTGNPLVKTKIGYSVSWKKARTHNSRPGPPILTEAIKDMSRFNGEIDIDMTSNQYIAKQMKPEVLFPSIHNFYLKRLEEEEKEVFPNGHPIRAKILQYEEETKSNLGTFSQATQKFVSLIRLGRFGGAESITLDGLRSIKIMRGRGRNPDYLDHSTTRAQFFENKNGEGIGFPFGWALLELIPRGEF
jgi:CRISPR-associated protein Csm5